MVTRRRAQLTSERVIAEVSHHLTTHEGVHGDKEGCNGLREPPGAPLAVHLLVLDPDLASKDGGEQRTKERGVGFSMSCSPFPVLLHALQSQVLMIP